MSFTDFLLILVLISQSLTVLGLIGLNRQLDKRFDLSKEDAMLKAETDKVTRAKKRLPPSRTTNT